MNHKKTRPQRAGFTLVELMLAMAFLSVMLIAIALLVMQIATMYNRGVTVRTINQASRTVVTDFQRTFGAANASAIDTEAVDTHGRLCTGQYSYIWTLPDEVEGGASINNNNRFADGSAELRLVRIVDKGGVYCQKQVVAGTFGATKHIAPDTQPVELLAGGDLPTGLRVRSLKVIEGQPTLASGERLYQVLVRLGTDSSDAIETTSNTCKPPSDTESDQQYCAINELSFVLRSGIR